MIDRYVQKPTSEQWKLGLGQRMDAMEHEIPTSFGHKPDLEPDLEMDVNVHDDVDMTRRCIQPQSESLSPRTMHEDKNVRETSRGIDFEVRIRILSNEYN